MQPLVVVFVLVLNFPFSQFPYLQFLSFRFLIGLVDATIGCCCWCCAPFPFFFAKRGLWDTAVVTIERENNYLNTKRDSKGNRCVDVQVKVWKV
jgi:hypothetical protein